MKLPNGYGGIHKLSGKRRKPWCARKTIGWKELEDGKRAIPIFKYIGYYPTKAEALQALAEYNQNPFDVSNKNMTLGSIYDEWSERYFDTMPHSSVAQAKSVWKNLEDLHEARVSDITLGMVQQIFDNSGKNKPVLVSTKSLLSKLFDYAIKHEYLQPGRKEIVRNIEITAGNPNKHPHQAFTKEEIEKLWEMGEEAESILMLIYTGLRVSEFLELKWENVRLEEKFFEVIKSKTQAGIRQVPIADKIFPLFEKRKNQKYLYEIQGERVPYNTYLARDFRPYCPDHSPHDTRHTCVSLLVEAGVDERIIKSIVGHQGKNITQKVYTHIDIPTKLDAINKI
jgi:integrase